MPHLPKSLQNIQRLRDLFDEIYVVIAFDQSDDDSFRVLKQYQSAFRHFDILTNPNPLSPIRTERIADARNAILEYTESILPYEEYPFLIMMDMDEVCTDPIRLDVIRPYLGRTDWDGLSFHRPHYYDIWALSIDPYLMSCWHMSEDYPTCIQAISVIGTYINDRLRNTPPDELVEVYSAFGGFAIYRRSQFRDCRYSPDFPLNRLTPEQFQNNIAAFTLPHLRTFDQTGIACGDCEHRAFHFAAIAKHDAKIRISPHKLF
jgi:hypothetical protein